MATLVGTYSTQDEPVECPRCRGHLIAGGCLALLENRRLLRRLQEVRWTRGRTVTAHRVALGHCWTMTAHGEVRPPRDDSRTGPVGRGRSAPQQEAVGADKDRPGATPVPPLARQGTELGR